MKKNETNGFRSSSVAFFRCSEANTCQLDVTPGSSLIIGDHGFRCDIENMFDELTMGQLRSQIEQHLLMVEEVLGGMDTFIQRLEKRVSRIEEGLGIEPEGISTSGWVADLQRVKTELSSIRNLVK